MTSAEIVSSSIAEVYAREKGDGAADGDGSASPPAKRVGKSAPEIPQAEPAAAAGGDSAQASGKKRRRSEKTFDPDAYEYRQIALGMLYVGEGYHGLAAAGYKGRGEAEYIPTVEGELFAALESMRLLPPGGRGAANFSRCGRTDAGVSALGQVLSLKLRSRARRGEALPPMHRENDYMRILNSALPKDIRITGWCPATPRFSARFCAGYRVYRYYFPLRGMDPAAMQEAANGLVGTHDFRNFCKPDVEKVTTFERSILSFKVLPVSPVGSDAGAGQAAPADSTPLRQRHSMWYFEIVGQAFLWHQVRCMAAVLFRVGRGLETPAVVPGLLDVQAQPCKPVFIMAHEQALCLYYCHFHDLPLWASPMALKNLVAGLEEAWAASAVKTAMLGDMLTAAYRTPLIPQPKEDTCCRLVSVYDVEEEVSAYGAGVRDEVAASLACAPTGVGLLGPSTLQAADSSGVEAQGHALHTLGAAADTVPRLQVPGPRLPGTAAAGTVLQGQFDDAGREPPCLAAVMRVLSGDAGHLSACEPSLAAAQLFASGHAKTQVLAALRKAPGAPSLPHALEAVGVRSVSALLPSVVPDEGLEREGPVRLRKYVSLLDPSHRREPSIAQRLAHRGLTELPSKAATMQQGGTHSRLEDDA